MVELSTVLVGGPPQHEIVLPDRKGILRNTHHHGDHIYPEEARENERIVAHARIWLQGMSE